MDKDTARLLVRAMAGVVDDLNQTAQSRSGSEDEPRPMTEADVERAIAQAFQSVIDAMVLSA